MKAQMGGGAQFLLTSVVSDCCFGCLSHGPLLGSNGQHSDACLPRDPAVSSPENRLVRSPIWPFRLPRSAGLGSTALTGAGLALKTRRLDAAQVAGSKRQGAAYPVLKGVSRCLISSKINLKTKTVCL